MTDSASCLDHDAFANTSDHHTHGAHSHPHPYDGRHHFDHSPPVVVDSEKDPSAIIAQPVTAILSSTPVILTDNDYHFIRQSLLSSPLLASLQSLDSVEEFHYNAALDRLIQSCKRVTVNTGEFLVKQSEIGDQLFIVKSGEIDVIKSKRKDDSNRKPHSRRSLRRSLLQRFKQSDSDSEACVQNDSDESTIVASAGAGAVIGELSVYYSIPRSASLLTRSPVKAFSIAKSDFEDFLLSQPHLSHALEHRKWLRSVLSHHYLYSHLDDEAEKERLVSSFHPHNFGHNEVIIRQGDDADKFYVVECGVCQVSTISHDTYSDVPIANIQPNQSFGEVALLYSCQRSATVRCLSDSGCTVWSIDAHSFLASAQRASLFLQHVFYRFALVTDSITNERLMTREQFIAANKFISKFQHSINDSRTASHRQSLTDRRLALMFRLADVSGDSKISFAEFLHFHLLLTHSTQCYELAYRMFDRNLSGSIDREEFIRVLKWLGEDSGEQLSDEELKNSQFISELFPSPSSTLSYQHFTQLIQSKQLPKFLEGIENDLKAIDQYIECLDTSLPLSAAFLSDGSSLLSLPSSIQSIDQIDDHLFKMPWRQLLAGSIAGGISRTLVSPLERLKILFQTQQYSVSKLKYTGIVQGLKQMHVDDGIKGFFRGNGSNMLRIMPTVALQFAFYDVLKRLLFDHPFFVISASDSAALRQKQLNPAQRLIAGAGAGVAACVITYPLDFIRARLTLQSGRDALYGGIIDGFRQVYRTEGILGFYRGLWPSLVGIAPYLGFDFAVYEGLKQYAPLDLETEKPSRAALFGCGALAGTTSQVFSFPLDTVRRRMQVQGFGGTTYHYSHSITRTMKQIISEEGFFSLYRGIGPNLLKVAPAVSTSFVIYEELREWMGLAGL